MIRAFRFAKLAWRGLVRRGRHRLSTLRPAAVILTRADLIVWPSSLTVSARMSTNPAPASSRSSMVNWEMNLASARPSGALASSSSTRRCDRSMFLFSVFPAMGARPISGRFQQLALQASTRLGRMPTVVQTAQIIRALRAGGRFSIVAFSPSLSRFCRAFISYMSVCYRTIFSENGDAR